MKCSDLQHHYIKQTSIVTTDKDRLFATELHSTDHSRPGVHSCLNNKGTEIILHTQNTEALAMQAVLLFYEKMIQISCNYVTPPPCTTTGHRNIILVQSCEDCSGALNLEGCTTDLFFICRNSSHLVLWVLIALQASKSIGIEATLWERCK
jgi:hypothetical protein